MSKTTKTKTKPAAAATAPPPKRAKAKLPRKKGNELIGLGLLTLGLLLAISLVSHDPADPSVLHQISGEEVTIGNWAGWLGAQTSDLAFKFLGLSCLGLPVLCLVLGWRRFRDRDGARVAGRGLGAGILVAGLPGLLQIAIGSFPWRGGRLEAGGAFGRVVSDVLVSHLNVPGAVLVLLALSLVGAALLLQSTLAEVLGRLLERFRGRFETVRLARSRRKEQREKEAARQRVVAEHVERAREARRERLGAPSASALEEPPEPTVRVVERAGERGFSIRKVKGRPRPEADEPAFDESAPGVDELFAQGAAAADDAPAAPVKAPPRPRVPLKPRPPVPKPAPQAAASPARGLPQGDLPFTKGGKSNLPPVNLLNLEDGGDAVDKEKLLRLGELIRERCAEFGVEGTIEGISPGPVITVYEFQPAPGVKVSQIVNLQDDLALSLKAESVRIDRLPGRSVLGIEVPNAKRQIIRLGGLLARKEFGKSSSVLSLALGVDLYGEPYFADLATMPHLLVAGATGAGKSVGLQSMITSILYKARHDQVKFIFIDPKRIELGVYADIPFLATPVVVEPKQAANTLNRMVLEMENRYKMLAKVHVRSIAHYNHAIRDPEQRKRLALNEGEGQLSEQDFQPMPYIVIIIDELADLMMVSSSEVETAIARLAQMARAVGIHLIIATQRPSVDVLTGTIKANFPCRISFATATRHDSRTILDQVGAEKLLGKGDMLFMPPGTSRVMRLHGAYISEQETAALIRWLKKQGRPEYDMELLEPLEQSGRGGGDGEAADDDLFDEAARLVVAERQASASFLQRRMRIGFSRASRLIDMMERDGLLGPPQGSKPREVLVPVTYFEEIDLAHQEA